MHWNKYLDFSNHVVNKWNAKLNFCSLANVVLCKRIKKVQFFLLLTNWYIIVTKAREYSITKTHHSFVLLIERWYAFIFLVSAPSNIWIWKNDVSQSDYETGSQSEHRIYLSWISIFHEYLIQFWNNFVAKNKDTGICARGCSATKMFSVL